MATKAERELIIRLHQKKRSTWQIADLTGLPQSTVAYWTKRFKYTQNLQNLQKSGRPSRLTNLQKEELKQLLREKMYKANLNRSGLNTKEIFEIIKTETKITFSIRHVRNLLRAFGFSKITPRTEHIRASLDARDSFKRDFQKKNKHVLWITK